MSAMMIEKPVEPIKRFLEDICFIVPAAGKGERMGTAVSKQYLALCGQPLIAHTLRRLLALQPRQIVLVVARDDSYWREIEGVEHCTVAVGGDTRAASVLAGLDSVAEAGWVMVHDAARPCVRAADILRLYDTVSHSTTGGLLGVPVTDTVKSVRNSMVVASPDRRQLWLAQTPQMFPRDLLVSALRQGQAKNLQLTDEASAIEALDINPLIVLGSRDNIKVTHADDLALAEYYLQQQARDPDL
ncbi:MAG: 2-C-methyl-D-erythritol 4-phosphate cytidylyltransferase [Candidatus Pseudothioglobus sp.]|jgi:2-C-methyl-D-erythritol 4-phosphate cytidylyltransferase